jgi:hypothetical protein
VRVVERVQPRSSGTADSLSRRWAKILAAALAMGGVIAVISYLTWARPFEATILSSLPGDVRARCTAPADDTAHCKLKDGTVVFYHLFPTVAEAQEAVSNGQRIEPISSDCPPREAPTVNTSIVCRYAIGPDKGLTMFSHTEKAPQSILLSRWVADAQPRLRGEMSTANAEPQDWETLTANWTRLATGR